MYIIYRKGAFLVAVKNVPDYYLPPHTILSAYAKVYDFDIADLSMIWVQQSIDFKTLGL